MKYFLAYVAESLRSRIQGPLNRTVVIFPNKRAGLFLGDCLLREDESAIWSPRYMTINELFCSLTTTTVADPIETVCRIHRLYSELTGTHDPLDFFYDWGERILADFEDLDKNLGDPSLIFRDLKEYEEIGGEDEILTDEQLEQLKRFAGDFSTDKRSEIRTRFLRLWQVMHPLYDAIRTELAAGNTAYEGQLYRNVTEALERGEVMLPPEVDHFVFVGFNVLSAVEKKLFTLVQKSGKALFYWDYDTYYTDPQARNEAGVFMQDNLHIFPNGIRDTAAFDNFLKQRASGTECRTITYAAADTESAQAQFVTQWLNEHKEWQKPGLASRTAIVLCQEDLLQPVLHALPEGMTINVTKGFPLHHTKAATVLAEEMERMLTDYHIRAALQQKMQDDTAAPTQAETAEILLRLETKVQDEARRTQEMKSEKNDWMPLLHAESFFQINKVLQRFLLLNESGQLAVSMPTLFRLVKKIVRGISMPFHGEPAVGVQVMGVLETRCLDFDNVLMLSVAEGALPQKATDASFIPFLIRKRYGLTTYIHKTAVYAYYFYRLLQRAKHVTLTYNASTEGTQKGEMSRFMKSMLVDDKLGGCIALSVLKATPKPPVVKFDEPVIESTDRPFKTTFSPKAINTYLGCPRAFYYEYIRRLNAPEPPATFIDARDFGTVFHKAAELLYSREWRNRLLPAERLREMLKDRSATAVWLNNVVQEAFDSEGVKPQKIMFTAILQYMQLLLNYDAGTRRPEGLVGASDFTFKWAEHEADCRLQIPFGDGGRTVEITLKGNIDRVDVATLNGVSSLRIIDYKTGGKPKKFKDIESLFEPDKAHDYKYQLQTLMYCLMANDKPLRDTPKDLAIVPALYFVPRMSQAEFSPYFSLDDEWLLDFRTVANDFRKRLTEVLTEIIKPGNPFVCCDEKAGKMTCKYCHYRALCRR